MTEEIDKVVDFLSDCETYLHSWACTRNGKYEMHDTRKIREVLMLLVANGSKNPIRDFKKGVEDGTILFSTYAFALAEPYKNELYKKHRQNVEEFEKKYHIKNETDQD